MLARNRQEIWALVMHHAKTSETIQRSFLRQYNSGYQSGTYAEFIVESDLSEAVAAKGTGNEHTIAKLAFRLDEYSQPARFGTDTRFVQ